MRKLIFALLYYSGVVPLMCWINKTKGRFPVLVFHRVSPIRDYLWQPCDPKVFEQTIRLLKRHYQIYPLEQILNEENGDKSSCYITFDDAFADTYQYALPILRRYQIPASYFVPTQVIAQGTLIWQMQLRNSFTHTSMKSLELEWSARSFRYSLGSPAEKKAAYEDVLRILSKTPEPDARELRDRIFDALGSYEDRELRSMSVAQLQELKVNGFEIHSHTQSHPFLSTLSIDRMRDEVSGSLNDLKTLSLISSPVFFAYPVGDYNDDVLQMVSKYYDGAFSVDERQVEISRVNDPAYRFRLPRFNIHHTSAFEVFALINGFHSVVRRVFKSS